MSKTDGVVRAWEAVAPHIEKLGEVGVYGLTITPDRVTINVPREDLAMQVLKMCGFKPSKVRREDWGAGEMAFVTYKASDGVVVFEVSVFP